MSEKRKKKTLTIEMKLQLIHDYETNGINQRELAKKYEIGQATVSDIIKKRNLYENEFVQGNVKFKQLKRTGKWSDLNELVFKFVKMAKNSNTPLSGPMIKTKASKLASEMGLEDFKCSDGWLTSFKRRYNVTYGSNCGKSAKVNDKVCTAWQTKLQELVKDYPPDCIYNCDETSLFYKMIPVKFYYSKHAKRSELKIAKQRLTLLLACNLVGEKLTPLVIGSAANLFGYDLKEVNDHYFTNYDASMDENIFREWLNNINEIMIRLKKKILIFMANVSSHLTTQKLSNVRLIYFPVNTTSKLQPLNAGIIKSFKSYYRHKLLVSLIAFVEAKHQSRDFARSVSVFDAMHWINSAWDEVKPSTIVNCFKKVGFPATSLQDEPNSDRCNINALLSAFTEAECGVYEDFLSSEEYINCDEKVERELLVIDEATNRETELNSDSETEPERVVSVLEAKNAVLVLQKFCGQSEFNRKVSVIQAGYLIDELIAKQKLQQMNFELDLL